jgi:hypothetical protein
MGGVKFNQVKAIVLNTKEEGPFPALPGFEHM